jgi:hypothetical protein
LLKYWPPKAFLPDYGSATGAVTLLPQATYIHSLPSILKWVVQLLILQNLGHDNRRG